MFGLPLRDHYILPCDLNMSSSYQAMMCFLKQSTSLPTAVIGVNDIVTIGAMQATKDFGLEVPNEVSFIGFDDIDMANEVVPALTTVHVDKKQLGELSVQRLVQLINSEPILFHKIVINPSIVERLSVYDRKKETNNETEGG